MTKVEEKESLLKAMSTLIDMATESELFVLGSLFDLQLRKACFVRKNMQGLSEGQIKAFHREFIVDKEEVVLGHMRLLNETDLNAVLLPFR